VWCGYCAKARAWLSDKGIAYREIDIDTPDGMASFAQAGGGKGVPLLVANGGRVQGFSPSAYSRLLARK
jgi:glutaredoxin